MGARSLGGIRRRRLSLPRSPRLPSLRALRRWLIALVLLVTALACGYFLWLRDSSLVAIERVEITGAEGQPAIEAALTQAAEEMTTLHVDRGALEAVVAENPAILSISTSTDFPHGLSIEVDSRRPAAFLPDSEAIVAGDGVVLEVGAERPEGLPVIESGGTTAGAAGARLEGEPLTLARVLGAAPEPLLPLATGARLDGEHGPVVTVGDGIDLRFGDPAQAELKWRAAAAVLADPELDSAVYLDVSVPSRPVVG